MKTCDIIKVVASVRATRTSTNAGSRSVIGHSSHVNTALCLVNNRKRVASRPVIISIIRVQMTSAAEFVVGKQYQTFEEFENAISLYQKINGTQFWRRDARTVASAGNRVKRPLSTDIKYYDVRYCCIHGGKSFKKQGDGVRKTT